MKNNKCIRIIIIVILILILFIILSIKKNNNYERKVTNITNENDKLISMMLETSAGSGEYQKTSASSWPTEGYIFNETLSKCEKGSSLSWDSTKNTVVMMGNVSDKCYVYFDVYVPPTINEVCSNGDTMSNCIKKLYTKQGENNLYLHDSTLTNGAGDNSYRYAGASETTNNFVCFGYDSTDGTCPTDNLYRIIGVFDNQVKLIKYDYAKSTLLGTDGDYYTTYSEMGFYYWNNLNEYSSINTWSESRLNTTNLNTNYLNNIGTKWSNKIATHTWKVGGNTNLSSVTVPNAYQNEITSPAENTTYDAKIGLMYVNDYGYAAAPSAWTILLTNASTGSDYSLPSITSVNWIYMGYSEWTIARRSVDFYKAFCVTDAGYVDAADIDSIYFVRPVFYLTSEITYVSGSGTISSPVLIN